MKNTHVLTLWRESALWTLTSPAYKRMGGRVKARGRACRQGMYAHYASQKIHHAVLIHHEDAHLRKTDRPKFSNLRVWDPPGNAEATAEGSSSSRGR